MYPPPNTSRESKGRGHQLGLILAVALVISAVLVGRSVAPAAADPGNPAADEAEFVALINQARANAGRAPLQPNGQLSSLARSHAQAMANQGRIFHANPISAGVTANWLKLGENVGTGPSVAPVMTAFMNSPSHLVNVVDPAFTHVGVGVVWVGNQLYTVHRFMQLETAPPPPPPPPPPTTTPTPTVAPPPTIAPPPTAPVRTTRPVEVPVAPPTTAPPRAPTASPERVNVVLVALRSAGL